MTTGEALNSLILRRLKGRNHMSKRRILSVGLICSFLLICSSMAAAQGRAGMLAKLKTHLALSEAQASDIGALMKKHQEAVFPLRQSLRASNHELKTALDTPEPSPSTVGQLVIARKALNKQVRALNVKLRTSIAAVLTPEQQQKLEQLKPRRARRAPIG
jgi:Spy/CpxP family protein refolding chaperone